MKTNKTFNPNVNPETGIEYYKGSFFKWLFKDTHNWVAVILVLIAEIIMTIYAVPNIEDFGWFGVGGWWFCWLLFVYMNVRHWWKMTKGLPVG